ncbi:putative alpha-glucoside transport protein-3 [Coleophoma crateriformis]|uniref:Putative alpha-glucoside transport protein-3 n=1 Tax=Coleophoma crateriformis TaxID=565419 RepID=A0A3D8QI20_9HELO|nr:putative alpha-glucoside transport protein-3 [Coleophoma crateriformis]
MSESIIKTGISANISPVSSQTKEIPKELEYSSVNEKLQGAQLNVLAQHGDEMDHHLGAWAAVKAYPWAVFWSVMVSMTVIMEGFDAILIGNFFAYPTFAQKYGVYVASSDNYQLTAAWQAGLGNASGVGAFFGILANGYLVNMFGQKRVLLAALLVLTCFIAMTFSAPNIIVLCAGEFLCGIPWGIFATIAPAYASEVLPLALRVYLTSYTNMCFIIGQLIAAGVLDGLVKLTSEWSYRIPFALQWVWPAVLLPVLCFMPESPWHLVRKGRLEEAEKSLRRLQSKTADIDPKQTLATIVHTNNLEEELSMGSSYLDCFRGFERRRTEIACIAFAGQMFAGAPFAYNSTYFFQQVGLSTQSTYNLNVGGTSMALFGAFVSWFCVMPYVGRRTAYLYGAVALSTILLLIGILNVRTSNHSVALAQASLCLVWTFVFQLSIGQLGWAIPAEIGSTRLRQKTVCLARNAYYITNVISNVMEPYYLNPAEWNLKGYVGFVWGGTAAILAVWVYFRLPETKGRSFEEIDMLFAMDIKAKNFANTSVDAFDEAETTRIAAGYKGGLA